MTRLIVTPASIELGIELSTVSWIRPRAMDYTRVIAKEGHFRFCGSLVARCDRL